MHASLSPFKLPRPTDFGDAEEQGAKERSGPRLHKMEGFENVPLPKLPGTEFYNPLDLARPRPQVFKVVNGIAGNYGEVSHAFLRSSFFRAELTRVAAFSFAVLPSSEPTTNFGSSAKEALAR